MSGDEPGVIAITQRELLLEMPEDIRGRLKVGAAMTAQLVWILAPRLPELRTEQLIYAASASGRLVVLSLEPRQTTRGFRHHFAMAVDSLERGL